MAIPDFQTLMLPILRRLGDGEPIQHRDLRAALAGEFRVTEDELAEVSKREGRRTR